MAMAVEDSASGFLWLKLRAVQTQPIGSGDLRDEGSPSRNKGLKQPASGIACYLESPRQQNHN